MVLHRSVYFATGSVYVVKMWVVSRFSAWATVTTFWHGFGYVNIGFAHLHKCRRDNLGGKLLLNLAAGLRKCHAYLVSKSSALFSLPPPPLSLWKCRTLTELSAKLFSWFLCAAWFHSSCEFPSGQRVAHFVISLVSGQSPTLLWKTTVISWLCNIFFCFFRKMVCQLEIHLWNKWWNCTRTCCPAYFLLNLVATLTV